MGTLVTGYQKRSIKHERIYFFLGFGSGSGDLSETPETLQGKVHGLRISAQDCTSSGRVSKDVISIWVENWASHSSAGKDGQNLYQWNSPAWFCTSSCHRSWAEEL